MSLARLVHAVVCGLGTAVVSAVLLAWVDDDGRAHSALVRDPTTVTADQLVLFHGTRQTLPPWSGVDLARPTYTIDRNAVIEPTFVVDLSHSAAPSLTDLMAPGSLGYVVLPLCVCCTLPVVNGNLALLDALHALMRHSATLVVKHPRGSGRRAPVLNGFRRVGCRFFGTNGCYVTSYSRVDRTDGRPVASGPLWTIVP
jgi:hypothetical protein